MANDIERALINSAIKTIKCLIEEKHDMESALIMIKLCKYIAGDDFEVTIERTGNE
jgi:hypothetical protein